MRRPLFCARVYIYMCVCVCTTKVYTPQKINYCSGVVSILEYALMLIVMIYNIGLFFAVVVGLMVGSLLFGHVAEQAAVYGLSAADETHKEDSVETGQHVVPTAYVVNGTGCHCDP